jgi:hypothetical protein
MDCICHSVYFSQQNHCKPTGKPCLFVKGSGVVSFAATLVRIANGGNQSRGTACCRLQRHAVPSYRQNHFSNQ